MNSDLAYTFVLNLFSNINVVRGQTVAFFVFGKRSISFLEISPVIQAAVNCIIRTYFKGAMLSIIAINLDLI